MMFKRSHEDVQVQKYEQYNELLKFKKILPMPGDGHCLIYSIILCMSEHMESHYKTEPGDVIHELKQEIESHYSVYCSFLPPQVDIAKQLQLFEEKKIYNLEVCDTFLLALCNCFNVEIVVAERSNLGIYTTKFVVEPSCPADESFPRRTFFLLKTLDHYDPMLSYGKTTQHIFRLWEKRHCKARNTFDEPIHRAKDIYFSWLVPNALCLVNLILTEPISF